MSDVCYLLSVICYLLSIYRHIKITYYRGISTRYNTPQKLDNKLRYTMKEKKHYL